MEFEGKVIFVGEEKSGVSANTGKGWRRRDFVVEETEGQYPKKCCFTAFNDTCNIIPNAGDVVKVSFDIDSHEYAGRYYNDIRAYKIERAGDVSAESQQTPAPQTQGTQTNTAPVLAPGATNPIKQVAQEKPQEESEALPF